MSQELQKRIITSVFLISLLSLMYFYSYVLIISLIVIAMIAWIEFYGLISKIFIKTNINHKIKRFTFKAISLFYLLLLIFFILLIEVNYSQLKIFIIYSILVSILSDIGGLIVGKIFKGKKLTKISPNKTISGLIGSFILSLVLVPFFYFYLKNLSITDLIIISIVVSSFCQFGDLFFSYLKRKAKVKDTGDILPGHGGILDRIDGILFAVPVGLMIIRIL
jgi:phosphatidate cytidylyltransferase